MGQGLNTKVAQVVAHELGVAARARALHRHRHAEGRQHLGHRGVDRRRPERQGGAGRGAPDPRAAGRVRRRAPSACAAREVRFADGRVQRGRAAHRVRRRWCSQAYIARVQLWSDGFYATPGLHWNRDTLQGKPFFYFAYGAAVSEVVVDTLTGESRLLRADVLHDVGRSLNPAIDIGQVEGAFIQGMGWLTTEELVWHPQIGPADDARAEHLQDPHRQRLPAEFHVRAVRGRQRGRQHPPQQGGRRAAAAAAVLGVLRDPRRGVGGRRPPRRPAAARAGHRRGGARRDRARCAAATACA